MIRLIKRYGSRKLYDTEESRYVSLEELGRWIRDDQQIRVIDNKTDDDVTAQTLAQIILEDGRRGTTVLPTELLHDLIRRGGDIVTSGVGQLQQGVDRLLQAGLGRVGPLNDVRRETDVLRQRLEELETMLGRLEHEKRARAQDHEPVTPDTVDEAAPETSRS